MSFMKKVAKIAAPFASLIPGVGPLIGAGLGALGSIGGGGNKNPNQPMGQPTANPQSSINAQMIQQLLGQTQGQSKQLLDTGLPAAQKGIQTHTNLINKVYNPLATGSRAASNQVLAPAISDLNAGYNGAVQAAGRGARSGGNGAQLMNLSTQKANDVARLRFGAQMQGAAGAAGSASSLISGGSSLAGVGQGGIDNALSAMLGIRGQDLQMQMLQAQINAQNSLGFGQGVGSLIGVLLGPGGVLNGPLSNVLKGVFGGNSSSNPPINPTPPVSSLPSPGVKY